MITDNIKNMSDEEVINLINKIVMEDVRPELSELKVILAEASGRKLEKNYINIIAERIKEKIQPEKPEPKRKTEPAKQKAEKPSEKKDSPKKVTFDDVYSPAEDEGSYDEDYDDERYPVLSFLASLYKVFAWVLFVGIIAAGVAVSVMLFKEKMIFVCLTMLSAVVVSVVVLLIFLGISEKIRLKIDIERHLRYIAERR